MKVLFLDIDGVLNHWDFLREVHPTGVVDVGSPEYYKNMLDSERIECLNQVVDETGAKIVVSSTWRKFMDLEDLESILKEKGFEGEVIGRTTKKRTVIRGEQIQKWLNNNKKRVDNYAIVDDNSDMGDLSDCLVQTSMESGLTQNHVKELVTLLNEE